MSSAEDIHYVADERHDEYDDSAPVLEVEDWHPEYDEEFGQEEASPALPVVRVVSPVHAFAYEVGHQVQPAPSVPPCTIIWRGQLKERRPETGLVHRTNVYRLNDGFWDCYREDELQAA
jgi:hypothetical protein